MAHYKFHVIPRFESDNVEVDWHRERDPGLRVRARYARKLREALEAVSVVRKKTEN